MVLRHRLLSAERAALGEAGLASGGLAEDGGAAGADDDGLGVGEDGGDGEAAGALDIHEEGTGGRHKGLVIGSVLAEVDRLIDCSYLQLVLASLGLRRRVEEVDRENLVVDRLEMTSG